MLQNLDELLEDHVLTLVIMKSPEATNPIPTPIVPNSHMDHHPDLHHHLRTSSILLLKHYQLLLVLLQP